MQVKNNQALKDGDESALNAEDVGDEVMFAFLSTSSKGFRKKKAQAALEKHGKEKTMQKMVDAWSTFKQIMKGLPPSN